MNNYNSSDTQILKDSFRNFVMEVQDHICGRLEKFEPSVRFEEDAWEKEGFGYGRTRVITEGKIFEKGGVNTSVVASELPEAMQQKFGVQPSDFVVSGISLVLHPQNPFVPTVHANYRYFELYDKESGEKTDAWFGGGADLTPYYLFPEDAKHFHNTHKKILDSIDPALYPEFKKECDDYFFNHHRDETRGIGGIFFDYQRPGEKHSEQELFTMAQALGFGFTDAYCPIVERRKDEEFSEKQEYWMHIRRGRYVEFNLIHDRGTLFGLKTKGRIESILMSLPPRVRWDYNFPIEPGSPEEFLVNHLKPVDWVGIE